MPLLVDCPEPPYMTTTELYPYRTLLLIFWNLWSIISTAAFCYGWYRGANIIVRRLPGLVLFYTLVNIWEGNVMLQRLVGDPSSLDLTSFSITWYTLAIYIPTWVVRFPLPMKFEPLGNSRLTFPQLPADPLHFERWVLIQR